MSCADKIQQWWGFGLRQTTHESPSILGHPRAPIKEAREAGRKKITAREKIGSLIYGADKNGSPPRIEPKNG